MNMTLEEYKRMTRGQRSREAGEMFEEIIASSLDWHEARGILKADKTPEPMKPLQKPNKKGQFLACYTKAGQPDFKGTLTGGRAVVFEAKHTDSDRIEHGRLTQEQINSLTEHHRLGAAAFIMVSFELQDFYRVPWETWRDMKSIYGHKHMTQTELEPFRVKYVAGVLKLLEGLYLELNQQRGHWEQPLGENFRTCSNCGISMGLTEGENLDRFKYCPFCGTKMDE